MFFDERCSFNWERKQKKVNPGRGYKRTFWTLQYSIYFFSKFYISVDKKIRFFSVSDSRQDNINLSSWIARSSENVLL